MKKFVIILLLLLPIVLMVTISLVGQMLATITYIKVESVAFVDEMENDISSIKVGKGVSITLKIKVLPELANNKAVTYKCLDEDVATISESGELTGIAYGYTTLLVETIDGGKKDKLTVNVTNEVVESVDIDLSEKQLYLYQSYTLTYAIYPSTAVDKKVTWTSSNPECIEVDANGVVTAKKITSEPIIITATTRDGGKTDTCEITVIEQLLAFEPQISGVSLYTTNELEIDLRTFVIYDETKVVFEDINFVITQSSPCVEIEDDKLIFDPAYAGQIVQLKAYVSNGVAEGETIIYIRYVSE